MNSDYIQTEPADGMPRECKPTVHKQDGIWTIRDPEQKEPRYPMAERLTLAWCIKQNLKRFS